MGLLGHVSVRSGISRCTLKKKKKKLRESIPIDPNFGWVVTNFLGPSAPTSAP